jgi:cytochrome c-type biogenesis protein CcsB
LPNPTDPYASWYNAKPEVKDIPLEDSAFLVQIIPSYLEAINTGNNQLADELVTGIANYQKKFGAVIIPSETKTNMEIRYNKMNIFQNLSRLYLILGLIMIILSFIEIFRQSKILNIIIKIFIVLIVIGFIYQTAGLIMRWYISGHAPWSDGYESLIYIAWVTLLAGLVFSNKSNMTIAATTFLTSIILMVAHLSWMDPEITNLVPVLKSYWLTIHVSIITASYGFLALSALLGLMNLILMILKNHKNNTTIDLRISNLTAINERSLMIGLYMLTIGTFLGGVWANESWGRYWGWDPKETWALVSVLIYAFISHMSSIPGLKDKFSFNFASLISYGSILMTYFGVNYYLSGLHSYAAGDPVPVPTFVYYMVVTVFVVSIWAYFNERRFTNQKASI